MSIGLKKFEECIEKVNYGNKIQRTEYLDKGKFPVVSQESKLINGFWNNEEDLYVVNQPVIVFGDHTRILKFIDFSFVLGADGTKIIKPKNFIDSKFFYYFLEANPIQSKGYSRHYRFLKELKINVPSLATQQTIVAKLDAIFAEIDTATAAAETNAGNAEALFQSYLNEVFECGGDGWETFTIKDLIKIRSGDFLPAKNMKADGVIDVYGGNGISGKHNLHNISGENIVIGRVGAKCGNVRLVNGDIWITDNAFYVSEYKIKLNKEFLALALKQKNLRELAHQMAQPVISFTTIKDAEIKIPSSISTQIKLLEVKNFLESQIEIAYTANIKKIKLFNFLKQSILQRAFSGELVKD